MSLGTPLPTTTLLGIKVQNEARELEERVRAQRKRGALVLVERFLLDHGYLATLERLQLESGVSLQKVAPAENISLLMVLQEFEEYFSLKYGHRPKFFRAATAPDAPSLALPPGGHKRPAPLPPIAPTPGGLPRAATAAPRCGDDASLARPGRSTPAPKSLPLPVPGPLAVAGTAPRWTPPGETEDNAAAPRRRDRPTSQPPGPRPRDAGALTTPPPPPDGGFHEERLLRPLPDFGGNWELRELAQTIQRDIVVADPGVRFTDIAALEACKLLLKEAIVMPTKYPQFFTGRLLKPWKGVLLFGPPGTGKTMLAKAVATECHTTFFNVAISTLVSKWRGDSEKLVRMLFDLARHHAPSTIFIDEIDSVMSRRSGGGSEHEGSRRMKTEVLIQMDGLLKTSDQVFVLAASNLPWDLDAALLRRLEKRIHVPLPGAGAREQMLRRTLEGSVADGDTVDFPGLALRMEGYSGADIDVVCREAAMRTLRAKMARLEAIEPDTRALERELAALDPVTMNDLDRALEVTKAAGSSIPDAKYAQWAADFGSGVGLEDPSL